MSNKSFSLLGALVLIGVTTFSVDAAVLVRMSGAGADSAGCGTVAAPCRTLQFAHDQVDAGGYVVAVDPADFGPVVISKPVTIANESPGAALVRADSSVASGTAIDIVPSASVTLRGLTIESVAVGVLVRGGGARFTAQDCVIRLVGQYAAYGISPLPPATPRILLTNVTIENAGLVGLFLTSRAAYARGVRLINNSGGVFTSGIGPNFVPPLLVFEEGVISNDPGKSAVNAAGVKSQEGLTVLRNSVVRGMPIGLDSIGLYLLSRSTITGNVLAFRKSGDAPMFQSFGNNVIRGNTDDALSLVTPAALH